MLLRTRAETQEPGLAITRLLTFQLHAEQGQWSQAQQQLVELGRACDFNPSKHLEIAFSQAMALNKQDGPGAGGGAAAALQAARMFKSYASQSCSGQDCPAILRACNLLLDSMGSCEAAAVDGVSRHPSSHLQAAAEELLWTGRALHRAVQQGAAAPSQDDIAELAAAAFSIGEQALEQSDWAACAGAMHASWLMSGLAQDSTAEDASGQLAAASAAYALLEQQREQPVVGKHLRQRLASVQELLQAAASQQQVQEAEADDAAAAAAAHARDTTEHVDVALAQLALRLAVHQKDDPKQKLKVSAPWPSLCLTIALFASPCGWLWR